MLTRVALLVLAAALLMQGQATPDADPSMPDFEVIRKAVGKLEEVVGRDCTWSAEVCSG